MSEIRKQVIQLPNTIIGNNYCRYYSQNILNNLMGNVKITLSELSVELVVLGYVKS